MTDIEKVGLVKFDFLGLKTLTMIHQAVTMVNQRRAPEEHLDIERLPPNDAKTYALLASGKTSGIFSTGKFGHAQFIGPH